MAISGFRLASALGDNSTDKRLDILRRIGKVGSISEAARAAGVSYKAAWQALETLTNLAGTELVTKEVGGRGGGGARLTAAGHQVLAAASQLDRARAAVLAEFKGRPSATNATAALFALRTSMRNQWPCRVKSIETVGSLQRVTLHLTGGAELVARVTRESVQLLELRAQLAVLALCKATAVTVSAQGSRRAAHNRLDGTVSRTSRATTGGAEIALVLHNGLRLVGFASAEHGLRSGDAAVAMIDESAIVIAIASA